MRLRDIGDPSYEWFLRREATLLATLSRPWESRPATVEEIGAILKTLAVDQRSRWDLMQIWHLGGEGPREVQKLLANLIKNRLSTSNPSKYISAGAAEARRYLHRPGYDHPDFWGWMLCRVEDKKGLGRGVLGGTEPPTYSTSEGKGKGKDEDLGKGKAHLEAKGKGEDHGKGHLDQKGKGKGDLKGKADLKGNADLDQKGNGKGKGDLKGKADLDQKGKGHLDQKGKSDFKGGKWHVEQKGPGMEGPRTMPNASWADYDPHFAAPQQDASWAGYAPHGWWVPQTVWVPQWDGGSSWGSSWGSEGWWYQ